MPHPPSASRDEQLIDHDEHGAVQGWQRLNAQLLLCCHPEHIVCQMSSTHHLRVHAGCWNGTRKAFAIVSATALQCSAATVL